MTERRFNDPRRDRNRPGFGPGRDGPPPDRPEPRRDPGAYIGRMPERSTATIPGGVGPRDQRVSAVATQPAPVRGPEPSRADAPAAEVGGATGAEAAPEPVSQPASAASSPTADTPVEASSDK